MDKYKIVVLKKARKFIDKQPAHQRNRIYLAIFNLPSGDVKLLQASNGLYRLRVGDYRIIFTVCNDILTITVVNAGNRGQVYNDL